MIVAMILAFDDGTGGGYSPEAFQGYQRMFIAHGEKFRKHAKWILGLFAIVMSLSLIGYFTQTGSSARRETDLPTIRGKPVDVPQYEKARSAVVAQYVMNTGR